MSVDSMANEVHHAGETKTPITPFTHRSISLSNTEAYAISRKLVELKRWNVSGRKIGFTLIFMVNLIAICLDFLFLEAVATFE